LHGPARNWNWHNVIGFWMCLPLFVISVCGVVIAFEWANQLVFKIAGSPPPPAKNAGGGKAKGPGGGGGKETPAPLSLAGLNQAWAIAAGNVANWESISARLPATTGGTANFTISESHRGRPDLKTQMSINLASGKVETVEPFSSYTTGRQARFWIRWLHTGEAGGWLGQLVAAFAAMGAVFLVWTGFALSWRRFKKGRNVSPAI
jgi:uncharacterized iron-regulated membrane protein